MSDLFTATPVHERLRSCPSCGERLEWAVVGVDSGCDQPLDYEYAYAECRRCDLGLKTHTSESAFWLNLRGLQR